MFKLYVLFKMAWYLLTHPRWTWKVYQGYREYQRRGGDFLDNDFYTLTMGQLLWRWLRHLGVTYTLTFRNQVDFAPGSAEKVLKWAHHQAQHNHSISPKQQRWLSTLSYMDPEFCAFLADPAQPKLCAEFLTVTQKGGKLEMTIHGPSYLAIYWPSKLMAKLSEEWHIDENHQLNGFDWIFKMAANGLELKENHVVNAEFAMRRRYSFFVQFMELLIEITMGCVKGPKDKGGLIGTSNTFLAHLFGLTAIGTIAHEMYLQVGAAYGYDKANKLVTKLWRYEYGNQLGYYLPDTYTSRKFFEDFTRDDALYFTGPRQDSGDPYEFIALYHEFMDRVGLKPYQKARTSIIFTDALRNKSAIRLVAFARGLGTGASVGMGGGKWRDALLLLELNQDMPELNMVIKPYWVWVIGNEEDKRGCGKISDTPGKATGEPVALKQIQHWLETGEITWTPLIEELPE